MTSSTAQKRRKIETVIAILNKLYPDARCSLNFTTPFELLAATIMSAQATDVRVNIVTEQLFAQYSSIAEYAAAEPEEIATIIRTVGCYRNKARSIVGAARLIISQFNSQVPQTMDELVQLPGVGRKTANVVLSNVFNQPGFAVDTHVKRVAYRLGWTDFTDPEKIEHQLCKLIPQTQWGHTSHLLIYHGRALCKARMPQCEHCPLIGQCPQRW
jgi:endonuclease-3